MKRNVFLLPVVLLVVCVSVVQADTIYVPSQEPTIQAGIDAAVDGDTVLVADGTYTGDGNRDIDFGGRAIVVTSENGPDVCIVDCDNSGRGFYFHTNEIYTSVLSGFKIVNGFVSGGDYTGGGGIYCFSPSSPTIENCIISGNSISGSDYCGGGGIQCRGSNANPVIRNCVISGNSVTGGEYSGGGGIFCFSNASPPIDNCTIIDNTASGTNYVRGGGIYCYSNNTSNIENCTINGNSVSGIEFASGGGVYFHSFSNATIKKCVISGNTVSGETDNRGGGIFCHSWSTPKIENCTVSGNSVSGTTNNFGGGIFCWESSSTIVNTIVEGNTGGYGIYFDGYVVLEDTIRYCDMYNNHPGNFSGSPIPPGLGQIVTVNANGDSCDTYSNIYFDPLFVDSTDYHLQALSPCIDAGDPDMPCVPWGGWYLDMGVYEYDKGFYWDGQNLIKKPFPVVFTDKR